MKLNQLFAEATHQEMSTAMRWISLLKPYMKQAMVGKAKKYVASLMHDLKQARHQKWTKTGNPAEFLDSPWYRVILFIPKDVVSHLLPLQSQELSFHTDDEFDDSLQSREYWIEIRPSFDPPISADMPKQLPPLVQKYLIQSVVDFREELKSMLPRETQ